MTLIPRTVDEILTALRNTRKQVDPVADSDKGPIAVMLYCYANELARVEQHASYLGSVYQLENAEELSRDDLNNLGRNYGKDPNVGKAATVNVTAYIRSRPQDGQVYTLPEGTLVATDDGRYIFATTREATLLGSSAELYYNSDERWYEITVPATATAVGDDYNVPAKTLTSFIGSVQDFDGVINRLGATNGLDPITPIQFRNIIWDAVQGLNPGLTGTMISAIYDISPAGFDAISIVSSAELGIFKRLPYLNGKIGYDVYIITDVTADDYFSGSASGGETEVLLPKRPVLTVEYVTVDGQSVPFTFVQDNTSPFAGSPDSLDKVVFASPLLPAQVYEVRYYYYSLIYDVLDAIGGGSAPFGADVLPRRANPVPVMVGAKLVTTSADNRESVINNIRTFTEAYFRNPDDISSGQRTFLEKLDPYRYQNAVQRGVGGVASFILTDFVRTDTALLDIETITFDGMTEYPLLSPQFIMV